MNRWTEKHMRGLLHDQKIRGYKTGEKRKQDKAQVIPREKSKAVVWLDLNLAKWANDHSVTLETEYRIANDRKYRWDYCFPALSICIEFNGGMFMDKSGHSSVRGLLRDSEKQNLAVTLGWKPIVITSLNYTTVIKTLDNLTKQ